MKKRFVKKVLNIGKFFLLICGTSYADSLIAGEYQIKAVFLLNFSNFVTWSPEAFGTSHTFFQICVFGDNPFDDSLDIAVEKATVEGHSVKTKYFQDLEKIDLCHVLFISRSKKNELIDILAKVEKQPILTISDIENFVVQGGMIQFFKHGKKKKIRFHIDPITIKESNLRISANLLRIANIIHRPHPTQ